jgi:hypothetical protein
VPETLRLIRIHVSSPGDVCEERGTLEKVVSQLQHSIGQESRLVLQLVRWEDSAVPAMGRSQEVINRQIPPSDVFVGILWSRFGTPTAEGNSGTEEEFNNALESWRLLGRPSILLYFCERPVNPSLVDPEQLLRLQRFRKAIGEQALYNTYHSVEEFEGLVRRNLTVLISSLAIRQQVARQPPRLFYSYAHEDAKLREELAKHLRVLERKRIIESWYDNMIAPGAEWSEKICEEMKNADIVVVLVSADFLDSDYCYTVEMEDALRRHSEGEVCVVPVIVRSALWEESPLAKLKVLPRDGRPVTLWQDRDEAWTDVARGIRAVAASLTSA